MSVCLSSSLDVVLPLVSMFVFHFSELRLFRSASLIVSECMRASLCALSDCELCKHEKYHSGCRARATECR